MVILATQLIRGFSGADFGGKTLAYYVGFKALKNTEKLSIFLSVKDYSKRSELSTAFTHERLNKVQAVMNGAYKRGLDFQAEHFLLTPDTALCLGEIEKKTDKKQIENDVFALLKEQKNCPLLDGLGVGVDHLLVKGVGEHLQRFADLLVDYTHYLSHDELVELSEHPDGEYVVEQINEKVTAKRHLIGKDYYTTPVKKGFEKGYRAVSTFDKKAL